MGRFVAVGLGGSTVYSNDGETWLQGTTIGGTQFFYHLDSIVYANGMYVAGGGGNLDTIGNRDMIWIRSTDGINWNFATTNPGVADFNLVIWDGSRFVACLTGPQFPNDTNTFWTSTDADVWTQVGSVNIGFAQTGNIAFAQNLYAIATNIGDIWTSPDLSTWTQISLALGAGFENIGFVNNIWVALGDSTIVYTSPDAVTWTHKTSPTNGNVLGALAFYAPFGGWLTGNDFDAGSPCIFLTTDDAGTWSNPFDPLPFFFIYDKGSLFVHGDDLYVIPYGAIGRVVNGGSYTEVFSGGTPSDSYTAMTWGPISTMLSSIRIDANALPVIALPNAAKNC